MAKKIYTCFACGFPMAFEETEVPNYCSGCGAPKEQFLVEPWCGSIEKRRIHVDPPAPEENRDPMDLSFHIPKDFSSLKGHGRIRRWVMGYDDPQELKDFYTDVFDWDIINTEHSDPEQPIMYCATGPGTEDWEPAVASMGYGYLIPKTGNEAEPAPSFVVEVKDIDDILKQVPGLGGKVIRGRYQFEGEDYAVIQDSEVNRFYIWEVKE